MGYFLKNRRLESAGSAVIVPFGATALRPANPINGTIRYNSDTSRFEIYYNGWKDIAIIGKVNIVKDSFTGDGSTAGFTMSNTPTSEENVIVFIGNIHQNPGTAYTVSSATLTFSGAPPLGQTIEIYHNFDSTDAN
jgi:hypothetical protein